MGDETTKKYGIRMIWPIQQVFFTLALVFTICSFLKPIDRLGRIFFNLIAGATWFAFGLGLFEIRFHAGGGANMVFYAFTLGESSTGTGIVWLFYALGFFSFLIGVVRAGALVYGPAIKGVGDITGERQRMNIFEELE